MNMQANKLEQFKKREYYFLETYQPSTLCILPMFHMFGIGVVTLHSLAVGGRMTTLPGFDPQTFLATLEETKVFL